MGRNSKILIIIIIIVIITLVGWYGTSRKSNLSEFGPQESEEPIRIGFVAPLTGDLASYGQGEKAAVEMAVQEINAARGINGRLLEIIYEDGKCAGKEAVAAAQKLINVDGVKIILGGACSGETLSIAPLAEENEVILFSAFSTSPDITQAGDYVFRNAPSDLDGGKYGAEMMFDDRHRKIAILSENTDYNQGIRKVLIQRFKELGGEIVADEVYEMEMKDYRTHLAKIKENKPDAVFFNPQSGVSGGLTVKQADELGITVPYYGIVAFSSGDALASAGAALNGLKFVDAPGLSEDNEKAVAFLEKYLSEYTKPASDYQVGARYDSVHILAEAIESCGEVQTSCIRNYLYNLLEYDGVIGKYRFDRNGDLIGIKYIIKKVVDAEKGEIIEVR